MKHYVKVHSQTKGEIACELCLNLFANQEAYRRHIEKFHGIKTRIVADSIPAVPGNSSDTHTNASGDSIFEISLTEFLSKAEEKQSDSLAFLENSDEDINLR